ncbi:MAG: hypothetical protein MUC83_10155 [Pirellula sp.]|jgi:hypothetical protein|nr:hypothetical protein [Pirellula sp.]
MRSLALIAYQLPLFRKRRVGLVDDRQQDGGMKMGREYILAPIFLPNSING